MEQLYLYQLFDRRISHDYLTVLWYNKQVNKINSNENYYLYYFWILEFKCDHTRLTGNIIGVRVATVLNIITKSEATSAGISSTDITLIIKSSTIELVMHPARNLSKDER